MNDYIMTEEIAKKYNNAHREVIKMANLRELKSIAFDVEEEYLGDCGDWFSNTKHAVTMKFDYDNLARLAILPYDTYKRIYDRACENTYSPKKEEVQKSPKEVEIKDIRVYGNRVVVMYFTDGTYTKAVCTENDAKEGKFDVDMGIILCFARKILGDDGNNKNLKHFVNDMHKLMKRKEAIRKKAAEDRAKAAEKKKLAKELIEQLEQEDYEKDKECIKNAVLEALKEHDYIHRHDGGDDGK